MPVYSWIDVKLWPVYDSERPHNSVKIDHKVKFFSTAHISSDTAKSGLKQQVWVRNNIFALGNCNSAPYICRLLVNPILLSR